jgi:hypothetical protein
MNAIRQVTIDNCVITGSNRGIAFMDFDGGTVSDVVLSNLSIECVRHDWFWWGDGDPLHFNVKRRSEISKNIKPESEPRAGKIRRVLISQVSARGQGSSTCSGHPESWLEDVTIDHLNLHLSSNPNAPYETAAHGLKFQRVNNLKLRDIEVTWDPPISPKATSALVLEEINGLEIDSFRGREGHPQTNTAAIFMSGTRDAIIRNSQVQSGAERFLYLAGSGCEKIVLFGNDVRGAATFWSSESPLPSGAVREFSNILRSE